MPAIDTSLDSGLSELQIVPNRQVGVEKPAGEPAAMPLRQLGVETSTAAAPTRTGGRTV